MLKKLLTLAYSEWWPPDVKEGGNHSPLMLNLHFQTRFCHVLEYFYLAGFLALRRCGLHRLSGRMGDSLRHLAWLDSLQS